MHHTSTTIHSTRFGCSELELPSANCGGAAYAVTESEWRSSLSQLWHRELQHPHRFALRSSFSHASVNVKPRRPEQYAHDILAGLNRSTMKAATATNGYRNKCGGKREAQKVSRCVPGRSPGQHAGERRRESQGRSLCVSWRGGAREWPSMRRSMEDRATDR